MGAGKEAEEAVALAPAGDESPEEAAIRTMDDVLQTVGAFGRWQVVTTLLFSWMELAAGMGNMLIVFMQFKPEMLCRPTGLPEAQWEARVELMAPTSAVERCGGNGTECEALVYDTSVMKRTIVTDWDLVCGREWETATAQMVHMLGILAGSAAIGPIGDKFGRKPCIFGSLLLFFLFFTGQAIAPYYSLFLVFRFLAAFSITGSWMTPFTYLGEMTTGYYRTLVTGLFFLPYAFGYALLSPLAYATRDWRLMCGIIGSLALPLLPFYFWFLESPRWLMVQGRLGEAAKLLEEKVAKRNGRSLVGVNLQQVIERIDAEERGAAKDEPRESMLSIRHFPVLMVRSVILILLWFANNVVYYGISLNISSFSGDLFLNNALFALVEIPSYGLAPILLRWGRKRSQILLLVVAGASLLLVPWVPGGAWRPASLTLAMLGKLAITASFAGIYVFTAELYPTIVRNSGLGFSSMASRIGGMVAPYVAIIAEINPSLSFVPLLLFGCVSLAAAVLVCFLPETMGRPLPDTLEDAVNQGTRAEESKGEKL